MFQEEKNYWPTKDLCILTYVRVQQQEQPVTNWMTKFFVYNNVPSIMRIPDERFQVSSLILFTVEN